MAINLAELPWRRGLLAILYGLITLIVLPIAIPLALSWANEQKALEEARVKRAIDFGVHNNEFSMKLNGLRTSMNLFLDRAFDLNLKAEQLREEQRQFRKDWAQQYLVFDQTAWWWHWNMATEAEVLKLCSPQKLGQLNGEIGNYHASVNTSVAALGPLWEYLRSNELNLKDKNKIQDMRKTAQDVISAQSVIRKDLSRTISSLFAQCDE